VILESITISMIEITIFVSVLALGSAIGPRALAPMPGKQPKLLQRGIGCPNGLEPLGGSEEGVVRLVTILYFCYTNDSVI
jgi:hypothetical protein